MDPTEKTIIDLLNRQIKWPPVYGLSDDEFVYRTRSEILKRVVANKDQVEAIAARISQKLRERLNQTFFDEEEVQMIRQENIRAFIGFQKALFNNTCDNVFLIQAQNRYFTDAALRNVPWATDIGRKVADDWHGFYRASGEIFKGVINKAFQNMEELFAGEQDKENSAQVQETKKEESVHTAKNESAGKK